MKSFKQYYLKEKRRNPEKNPVRGAWYYAEQYRNESDIYISFTQVDKIGVNPHSDYNTPVGIYCYPLTEFWEQYIPVADERTKENNRFGSYAPFAGKSQYVNFIKLTDKKRFIEDMYKDYSQKDFEKDMQILEEIYREEMEKEMKKVNMVPATWEKYIEKAIEEAYSKHPVSRLWNVTRNLADFFSDGNPAVKWNAILRKDLGYTGFADKSGHGFIHGAEPMQAVFLTTRAFDVITRQENKKKKPPYEIRKIKDKLEKNPDDVNDLDDDTLKEFITHYMDTIDIRQLYKNLDNPSEEINEFVAKLNPDYISFVESLNNESMKNILEYVYNNFRLDAFGKSRFIDMFQALMSRFNPSDEVIEYAVSKKPTLISDVLKPSDDLIETAIENDWEVLFRRDIKILESWMFEKAWETAKENSEEESYINKLKDIRNSGVFGDVDVDKLVPEKLLKNIIQTAPRLSITGLQLEKDDLLYALDFVENRYASYVFNMVFARYVQDGDWDRIPVEVQKKLLDMDNMVIEDLKKWKQLTPEVKKYFRKKYPENSSLYIGKS